MSFLGKDKEEVNCTSTAGVECSNIRLANGEISVWDFGGQLEYTVTHQFFLSAEVSIDQCLFIIHTITELSFSTCIFFP